MRAVKEPFRCGRPWAGSLAHPWMGNTKALAAFATAAST